MKCIILRLICAALSAVIGFASVGGRIAGTISDSSGAILQKAKVTLTNLATGAVQTALTGKTGSYAFPVLPPGRYTIEITFQRFSSYTRSGIVVDANSALVIDASLQSGRQSESITVTDSSIHTDTASTQLGDAIPGRQITAVPLNGRSFTDLLSLQPGVAPATSINATTVQDVGASVFSPFGQFERGHNFN